MSQPIFIFGTQRGGTTLLRLMLNMNSKLCIPPESHFLIPFLEEFDKNILLNEKDVEKAFSLIENNERIKAWDLNSNKINDIRQLISYPISIADFIDLIFQTQAKYLGKIRWGEKTPEYIDIVADIKSLFPRALFLFLIRDGRDVSISLKTRGWQGWTTYEHAIYWKRCVNIIEENYSKKNAFLVKYEDLVIDTERNLKKICGFLKLDFEQGMLDFNTTYDNQITHTEKKASIHTKLKRKPKKSDIYRWKLEMSSFRIWKFESIAHKELKAMNYEVVYYNASNPIHFIGRYLYILPSVIISSSHRFYHWIVPKQIKTSFNKNFLYLLVKRLFIKDTKKRYN